MLIVMDKDATPAQIEAVVKKIQSLGYEASPMPGGERVAIGILRNLGPVDSAHFVDMAGVIQAIPVSRPYKLVEPGDETGRHRHHLARPGVGPGPFRGHGRPLRD